MGMFDLGIGSIARGFKSFMNPQDAYKKARKEYEPHYQKAQEYLQPYNEQGQAAYKPLQGAMQSLLNPTQQYDEWLDNYKMSDAAKFAQERAGNQGLWAANAMGMGGSTPALGAIQAGTNQIGAEDQQRYIDQLLQRYLSGAQIAQGIYGQGGQMAGQMSNNSMQHGQNLAQMKYGEMAAPGQMFGNVLGTAASLGGAYMGMQGSNNLAASNNNLAKAWSTGGGR